MISSPKAVAIAQPGSQKQPAVFARSQVFRADAREVGVGIQIVCDTQRVAKNREVWVVVGVHVNAAHGFYRTSVRKIVSPAST